MKKNYFIKTSIIILVFHFLTSCISINENYILNEEFEINELGWVEEQNDFHFLEINNGEYYIHSIDTNSARSSTGSKADLYLYGLPKEYEIKTSFKTTEIRNENTHFGIILYSSTMEYLFIIYPNGDLIVSEYDYNNETHTNILGKNIKSSLLTEPIELLINVNDMEFTMYVNDLKIGNGKFKTKTSSWNDLRLFTSSKSAILIDYLKIYKK
jgi:hypothetical protein